MKKLIYIFLLGLVFVACDKNDENLDLQVLAPAEKEIVSISNTSEISEDMILDLVTRLSAIEFPVSKVSQSGKAAATDYIKIVTGVVDGAWYEFAFSEENTTCDELGISTLYLENVVSNSSNVLEVRINLEDDEPALTLAVDVAYLFASNIVNGVKLTQAGVITQGTATGLSIVF